MLGEQNREYTEAGDVPKNFGGVMALNHKGEESVRIGVSKQALRLC
jgi:hypothetical protein